MNLGVVGRFDEHLFRVQGVDLPTPAARRLLHRRHINRRDGSTLRFGVP
jgi:hypothetical protein